MTHHTQTHELQIASTYAMVHDSMPLKGSELDAYYRVMGVQNTPLYAAEVNSSGSMHLKFDHMQPTGSSIYRGAAAMIELYEPGTAFVTTDTSNALVVARAAQQRGCKSDLVCVDSALNASQRHRLWDNDMGIFIEPNEEAVGKRVNEIMEDRRTLLSPALDASMLGGYAMMSHEIASSLSRPSAGRSHFPIWPDQLIRVFLPLGAGRLGAGVACGFRQIKLEYPHFKVSVTGVSQAVAGVEELDTVIRPILTSPDFVHHNVKVSNAELAHAAGVLTRIGPKTNWAGALSLAGAIQYRHEFPTSREEELAVVILPGQEFLSLQY
ncbi:MAG TPA: pyridoxal-phosphate dependent enzyme [Patescibacteria group bacterium]|nr:pyridoxal-phosphate dependent enzyme [Patescibacteria group bacterium]